jgi:hypothetical protein
VKPWAAHHAGGNGVPGRQRSASSRPRSQPFAGPASILGAVIGIRIGSFRVKIRSAISCASLVGALALCSLPALAGSPVVASGHVTGTCMDIRESDGQALLGNCHGGATQQLRFRSGNHGQIVVLGLCLSSTRDRGSSVMAVRCANAPEQRWSNLANGQLRNERGLCADVEHGGGTSSRIIAWECKGGASERLTGSNQRWGFARFYAASELGDAASSLQSGKIVPLRVLPRDAGIVAGGGGSLVPAGSVNIAAVGSANAVVSGSGNLLAPISGVVAGRN